MRAEGVALVTGASRGLGRAIALELAAAGFEVVASMRDPAAGKSLPDEAAERGGRLRVERLDVTQAEPIAMPEGLRVLVNNAGVEREFLPVEHQPLEQYRLIYETNVFGCVRTMQAAIPRLKAAGGGVICNVTSSSYLAAMPFYAAYRSSKAALAAIGESLRTELAPFGIRIVEIMPGPDRHRHARGLGAHARGGPARRLPRHGAEGLRLAHGRGAAASTSPEVAAARVRQRDPRRRRAAAPRLRSAWPTRCSRPGAARATRT